MKKNTVCSFINQIFPDDVTYAKTFFLIPVFFPFCLQNSYTSCDGGTHGYDVIEESLEFLNTERNSTNTISFCHFWDPTQCK